MIEEIFKDIKGFENLYQVSNLGNIKSLPKKHNLRNGHYYIQKEQILKPIKDNKGYFHIDLVKKRKHFKKLIHRLVAETFINNPRHYEQVNHKDGCKTNNCVENLEWCSCKDNIQHAWENGLCHITDKHRIVASKTQKERWKKYRKMRGDNND
jgi:hypothetical protein